MKKINSDIRFLAAQSLKRRKASKRQFYFSIISLFIACAIFITGTVSWFTISTAKLDAGTFTLECGKGLRVNDSGESDFQLNNVQKYILPASSVDGRNLFFPTDGTDFSSVTDEITYRSSNVGDKNQNYVQIDFTLTAQENNTALYINDEVTEMWIEDPDTHAKSSTLAAPLRLAIWSATEEDNSGPITPIVFNPTSKTYTTAAVSSVDSSSGKLLNTGRQVSHTFTDYAYGGDPVAILSKGVETKLSIVIWLEGADPKCTYDKVNLKDIGLNIAFSTSWDKTQVVRFRDWTGSGDTTGWVKTLLKDGLTDGNKTINYDLYLHYKKHGSTSSDDVTDFLMYPYNAAIADATEWMCNMPGDMSNEVSFELRPSDSSYPTYKFTKNSKDGGATDTLDRGVNRLYTAEESARPATASAEICKGYWVDLGDSDGGGSDFHDLDGDDF